MPESSISYGREEGLKKLTVACHTLEGLGKQRTPVHVQGMKPRWIVLCLELVCVLVCILLLHGLESRHIEVRKVLAVFACGLVLLCHGDCILAWVELFREASTPRRARENNLYCLVNGSALVHGTSATLRLPHNPLPTTSPHSELRSHIGYRDFLLHHATRAAKHASVILYSYTVTAL